MLTALAFEAAYQTRLFLPLGPNFFLTVQTKALLLGAAILTWMLIGYWLELYDRLDSAHLSVVVRDTFRQSVLGGIVLILFQFLLRLDLSRAFLLLFGFYSWFFLCLFRWRASTLVGLIRREFGAPHYVMVVGLGDSAMRIAQLLERSEPYGIRLAGFIADDASPAPEFVQLTKQYIVHPLSRLSELLQRQIIDEIIFAVDSRRLAELEDTFLLCDEEGVRTHVSVDFFPHVNSDVYLDRIGPAPLLTFAAAPDDEIRLMMKRLIDIVLAGASLIVLLPFMAVVALLVRITSPGPAIFRQIRCGLNGRRFVCFKFRSMCVDAETRRAELEHLNRKETAFKIPDDPRLTPIGRYMRKFSVDEWPQLWNVLRGEMSLVGPRPAIPEEVEKYKRWQRRRLRMRPGLTCLWAISGRDELDFDTWMKLDMQYIDRWSLALDWHIILRTIPQVLLGKGAH
ncbi:MAG TPA: sugar transferase [Bryobacteraceae bacterium]|nr:sugar transferase [Bryobacteraceae bacterium]